MKFDIAEHVTATIVAHIESMEGKPETWTKPWISFGTAGYPTNVVSKKTYRGINAVMLGLMQHHAGYASNLWGTYKQWMEKGAQVRKGQKAHMVVYFKLMEGKTKNAKGETSKWPMLRYSNVFNASQVEGYEIKSEGKPEYPNQAAMNAACESFIEHTKIKVNHVEGSRAFYSPKIDEVTLPLRKQFKKVGDASATETYYGTAFHELTHATGHKDRCDRSLDSSKYFGDPSYAFEELVAEIGAGMLCCYLGVSPTPRKDHAMYIASWLKALRNDKKLIFKAASLASDAGEWMFKMQPKARVVVKGGQQVAA